MAQLNDLIVTGESRFLNKIHGTIEDSDKVGGHDTPSSGDASTSQVVLGNDTRLTDSRTPTSHTHGNIQNGGTLQSSDVSIASGDKLVVTDSSDSNKIARSALAFDGSTTTKFLSQKGTWETPGGSGDVTGPSSSTSGNITTFSGTTGKVVQDSGKTFSSGSTDTSASHVVLCNDSRLSDARTPTSHTHGNMTNLGQIVSAAVTPAQSDYLLLSDASNSGKIERGIIIGNNTTKFLQNDGTWQQLQEEKLKWGGPSLSGQVSPIGVAASPEHSANRLALLNSAALDYKYSTDGGTTWVDYTVSDYDKPKLVTEGYQLNLPLGRPIGSSSDAPTLQSRTQVTITAVDGEYTYVYTRPKKMLINISSAKPMTLLVETRTGTNYLNDGAWATFGTFTISGWSGWSDIPLVLPQLGGGASQTGNIWQLRLTFSLPELHTTSTSADILGIRIFGDTSWTVNNNLAKMGHIYSFDMNQNTTFPAMVNATGGITSQNGDLIATQGTATAVRKIGITNTNNKFGGLKVNTNGNNIEFGWDYDSAAGSGAYFRGSGWSSSVGEFGFYARTTNASTVQLVGKTNGALTWNNRRVVTATNGSAVGSTTKPVYIDSSGYVQECSAEINTRKIFVEDVTTPYNVGDLWLGSDGTFQCITAKASGEFDVEDWEAIPSAYLTSAEVTALINQATQLVTAGGSIVWNDANTDGKYDEILLLRNDNDPTATVTIDNATSVYKFDGTGLYHSSTGYRGTYTQILDQNGEGIADFLQHGTLDASKVSIVNFNSSMITAGLLKRGGSDNQFGTIEVYNNSGVLIAEVSKTGFKFYGPGNVGQRSYIVINDTDFFAGYDANNTQLFKVTGDVFNFKKISISDEVRVCGELNFIPITITENNTVVNEGVAIVGLV